jgi:hypothetical protein
MVLTEEKIESNAKTYFKTGEKYGFINDAFIEKYGEALMNAPYSKTDEGPNCFDGGLIQHIIAMTKHALSINESLSEGKQVVKESLIKVCFLHQIGKANMFVKNDSKWHIDRGLLYEFNDEEVALKVAEKSLKYLSVCGISLTEDEYDAIALYGSEFANRPLKTDGERIAAIIKAANVITIIDEK